MKHILLMLFLFVPAIGLSSPDDVFLKDSTAYRNVRIIDTVNSQVRLKTRHDTISVNLSSIVFIKTKTYVGSIDSYRAFYQPDEIAKLRVVKPKSKYWDETYTEVDTTTYNSPGTNVNFALLSLGVLSVGLAWDFYAQSSDINDMITLLRKSNLNSESLESAKTRKQILSLVSLVAGVALIVESIQTDYSPVHFSSKGNNLLVSYNF